jgi:hypothetical protein
VTPSLYKIDHDRGGVFLEGGVGFDVVPPGTSSGLLRSLVVGARAEVDLNTIDGFSDSEIHNDTYDWERPAWNGSIQAIGDLGASQKLGLDFRYASVDGKEDARINWSTQFFLNPTGRTLKFDRASTREGGRAQEAVARWEMRPKTMPWSFAGSFAVGQTEYWQTPELNFNSFVTAKNLRDTSWEAIGGAAYALPRGRGVVAGELAYGFTDIDNRVSRPTTTVPEALLQMGVGGEYFPYLSFGVRAGYRYLHRDGNRDLDDATLDETTHRGALGIGYRLPDSSVIFDAAVTYERTREDEPPVADLGKRTESTFTIQARWLL